MKKLNEKGMIELVVVLVLALGVGMAGGYIIGKNAKKDPAHSSMAAVSTASAADLRSDMVTLGVEHMILTDQAVDAALDGSKNADATAAALYKNGTDIGAAVGSVYGKEAETTFNSVWKIHLDQFVNYAVASSKGDEAAKKMALETISTQYTKPLAAYLAKANPNLPEETLRSVLEEHVGMTARMIDFHVAGDYSAEANELKMANQHIKMVFNTLADGIAKQYPDKF